LSIVRALYHVLTESDRSISRHTFLYSLSQLSTYTSAACAQGSLRYKGPMDVVRQVMRLEGGVMGLYKGLVPTLFREVPGCAAMFAAYEAIKLGAAKQQVNFF